MDQLNDGFSVHANLIKAMGMAQIDFWCLQLECTEEQLLDAVHIVGFSAQDIYLYLHHRQ